MDAATSRARPRFDYASMPAEEFVIIWSYMRCVTWFSVFLVARGAGRDLRQPSKELDEMCEAPLRREKVLGLAEWYYEPGLFLVLAECMSEEPYLIKELDRKLPNRQITKNVTLIPETTGADGDVSQVFKALTKDRRDRNLLKAFPRPHRSVIFLRER